jgi:hypothetical protein
MLFRLQNRQARLAKTAQNTRLTQNVNETGSALSLLMLRVLADDTHGPVAADDLAVAADLFYRSPDFHDFSPKNAFR